MEYPREMIARMNLRLIKCVLNHSAVKETMIVVHDASSSRAVRSGANYPAVDLRVKGREDYFSLEHYLLLMYHPFDSNRTNPLLHWNPPYVESSYRLLSHFDHQAEPRSWIIFG